MNTEFTPLEGGCACRFVRFRMTTRPLFVHCCHCRWCQRETGPSFALNALIETDRVELLAGDVSGVGYLLKDRVIDVEDFLVALRRVADGGSAVDADVVRQILSRSQRTSELEHLTPREREVLELMAEGLSNGAIAQRLVVSAGAVEKHISNVFSKLGLQPEDGANRRVMAVLTYLRA